MWDRNQLPRNGQLIITRRSGPVKWDGMVRAWEFANFRLADRQWKLGDNDKSS